MENDPLAQDLQGKHHCYRQSKGGKIGENDSPNLDQAARQVQT